MTNIPCNYKNSGEVACWLCGAENVRTEHYFECSEVTNVWNVEAGDMASEDIATLVRASKHLDGVAKRNVLCPYGQIIQ